MWLLIKVDRVDMGSKVKRRRRRRKCHHCGPNNKQRTRKDRATQPTDAGRLRWAKWYAVRWKQERSEIRNNIANKTRESVCILQLSSFDENWAEKGGKYWERVKKMIQNNNLLVTLVKSNFSDSLSFHYTSISRVTTTWDDSYSSRKI